MKFDEAKDIMYGLKPDWDKDHFPIKHVRPKLAPNKWDAVKNDPHAHGKDFDYRIMDGDVFMPCCDAAQEYVYAKFPEGSTYYTDLDGWTGVKITAFPYWSLEQTINNITNQALKDGLLSEELYERCMEDDALARQADV